MLSQHFSHTQDAPRENTGRDSQAWACVCGQLKVLELPIVPLPTNSTEWNGIDPVQIYQ